VSDEERPPPWAGGPGYVPPPELPPHAPMPGAPPYPAATAHPPAPVGRPAPRTRFRAALAASAVWGAVLLVLVPVVDGPLPDARSPGLLVGSASSTGLITAVVVWAAGRRRTWPFWLLVLVAAPVFWVLRALLTSAGS